MFDIFKKKPEPSPVQTPVAETLKEFTNSLGMEFLYVDGGEFTMGRNPQYEEGGDVESPPHSVRVGGFWVSKYPVTQEQYFKLTRINPSYFKNDKVEEESSRRHPVEQVSWFDAKAYVELLNRYEGKAHFYALPTEAQWEYVAKAGGNTRFTFGDSEAMLDEYAVYEYTANLRTAVIGSKQPNRLGIYDLIGNVWEWCEDDFFANYNNAPSDGRARLVGAEGIEGESFKVRRGGSFKTGYLCLRSSFRGYSRPDFVSNDIGFRLVINADPFS
ncbi:formylglycine-generating enzyme family protein [Sulfuricurvum sp. IAE1]|uniref:formylglycine-generating enzyme family protein n=1 Tax=Sulfuricurvum sp. IAE1 TaxID=2546102 RepID=UPI0010479579|nr:formylglycine-generating enzyme family protein [Sulfuricurvum sp. IAE1]TDA62996.1 formylglycine-generating enzyme family protein [Sulfuricurvum sp. IAE1]